MINEEMFVLQSQINELKKNYEEVSSYNKSIEKFNFILKPLETQSVKSLNFKCFEKYIVLKFRGKQNCENSFYINFNSVTIFKTSEKVFAKEFILEVNKVNSIEIFYKGNSDETIKTFMEIYGSIELENFKGMNLSKINSKYYLINQNEKMLENFDSLDMLEIFDGGFENLEGYIACCEKYNISEFKADDLLLLLKEDSKYYVRSCLNSNRNLVLENGEAYGMFPILDETYKYGLFCKVGNDYKIKYFKLDNTTDKEAVLNLSLKFDIFKAGGFYYIESGISHYGFWFIDVNNDAYLVFSKLSAVGETNEFYEPIYVGKSNHINMYLYNSNIVSFNSINNFVVYSEYSLSILSSVASLTKTQLKKYKNVEYGFIVGENKMLYSNGCLTYL